MENNLRDPVLFEVVVVVAADSNIPISAGFIPVVKQQVFLVETFCWSTILDGEVDHLIRSWLRNIPFIHDG